jgi:CO/xanthine dehydrogenase Mo-binding subunit
MTTTLDRRSLLKATGSLSLAFAIPLDASLAQAPAPQRPRLPGDLATSPRLDSWLRINADGTVTLMVGKVELGQGILTAVAQVCAEELDIDIGRIRIVSGDTALVPDEGVTAGSFSMPNCATAVRHASAEARAILVDLAAAKLGEPAASLAVADGVVRTPGGRQAAFWDLVTGKELAVDATGQAKLKPASAHRYIGRSVQRLDLPAKLTGGDIFLQDLRPAGMLHGRVVRPPAYKATLASLDVKPVEAMAGVVKVVRNGSFLGVVAETEDQAIAAMQALEEAARWTVEKSMPGHEGIYDWLLATKPARDIAIKAQARADSAPVARTIEASYRRPYQMHASIGPSAAIATLGANGVMTIQTHSQSVFETGAAIAQMLGVAGNKVRCQHVQGSGCYGHNMADDAAADAALLATTVPGRPVRLQYSRAQEHLWEPYGSAMVVKTAASLDKDGNVLDWTLDLWSTPHGTRPGGNAGNLLSARYLEKPFAMPVPQNGGPPNYAADRNAIALYEFPGHKVTTHFITEMPLRASSTRGLGAYGNIFAIESFIDELAAAAGADPVAYRLRFLKDDRARTVLVKAAEAFGWEHWQKRPDHGRGIAFARYKNVAAYCAVALEVAVDRATGEIRVLRATAANEAGEIVSPDGIANQIEGGLIQSLSWSLKEEVKFDDTRILSDGWHSYPILRFSETPAVEVVLIDRPGAPFLGTGEASQGPTGAALANAVFDATGARLRQLPFTPERVKAGLRI